MWSLIISPTASAAAGGGGGAAAGQAGRRRRRTACTLRGRSPRTATTSLSQSIIITGRRPGCGGCGRLSVRSLGRQTIEFHRGLRARALIVTDRRQDGGRRHVTRPQSD